jgi:hypothetical protein
MLAMHARIPRVAAQRQLDLIQAQSVQHMKTEDARKTINDLIERCAATVSEAIEHVVWNGSVMRSARQLRGQVLRAFGHEAAA